MAEPNPGSAEAIERSCTCPVIDNHQGAGIPNPDGPQFYVNWRCPLHADLALPHPAPLSRQHEAELRKIAAAGMIGQHWAFAPMCWALLHRRGFLTVECRDGFLYAIITDAGRAMLSPEGQAGHR